ncbi:MAG: choice-of-anchor L domain-containing protein [Burkholderiales bacterium]|nr:choice-of-anchor L domain-containing protein [Nitrosomonas sp.]MCP5275341.1 choice-of-anchor L domain-containing protein [Burkholderiales bacterium]
MPAFTVYDPENQPLSTLISALLTPSSGITVNVDSVQLKFGIATETVIIDTTTFQVLTIEKASLSFYDGSIATLGIGAGLFLTSGDSDPPETNTELSFSKELEPSENDSDLNTSVQAAFPQAGEVQDATVLEFQFNVEDPALNNIKFDLIFGSDEFPEFSNTDFVDIAGVYINGKNYALFNNQTSQPLSILDTNLAAGNFRNNENTIIPLEYDGISNLLNIIAPVNPGVNTIKIAIGDTGDQIYDSGLFISNLQAVNFSGSGLALTTLGTDGDDPLVQGKEFNEIFELGNGNDNVSGGLGDDVLNGGNGFDTAIFSGAFAQYSLINTASGHTVTGPDGNDVLVDIEFALFGNDLFALDTQVGDATYNTYALLQAALDAAPSQPLLSQWVAKEKTAPNAATLAQTIIDTAAPGISNATLITHLFQTIAGVTPSQEQVNQISALVGPGNTFPTQGHLFAAASQLELNTSEFASIVGTPLELDLSFFV